MIDETRAGKRRTKRRALVFRIAAHPIQVKLVQLVAGRGIDDLTLRAIGQQIGVGPTTPQRVKHHLNQLVKYGFLDIVGGRYRIGKALV